MSVKIAYGDNYSRTLQLIRILQATLNIAPDNQRLKDCLENIHHDLKNGGPYAIYTLHGISSQLLHNLDEFGLAPYTQNVLYRWLENFKNSIDLEDEAFEPVFYVDMLVARDINMYIPLNNFITIAND